MCWMRRNQPEIETTETQSTQRKEQKNNAPSIEPSLILNVLAKDLGDLGNEHDPSRVLRMTIS